MLSGVWLRASLTNIIKTPERFFDINFTQMIPSIIVYVVKCSFTTHSLYAMVVCILKVSKLLPSSNTDMSHVVRLPVVQADKTLRWILQRHGHITALKQTTH